MSLFDQIANLNKPITTQGQFPLTDFSASKLLLLSEAINNLMEQQKGRSKANEEYPEAPDDAIFNIKNEMRKEYADKITDLREMNVWVLTAFQIVNDRELK